MIAEARIPNDNAEVDGTKYQDREGGKCALKLLLDNEDACMRILRHAL